MNKMEIFKLVITQARKKKGFTQEAFAAKLGITPQAVSKWENGIGYPDVTLFPDIAEELDIPIESLFGKESKSRRAVPEFPQKYRGLDFVFSKDNKACYSSKAVENIDTEKGIAYFTDGSYADLMQETVGNMGEGEIRIYKADNVLWSMQYPSLTETELDRALTPFKSITLNVALGCKIKLIRSDEGNSRISATGDPVFIDSIKSEVIDGNLTVDVKSRYNNGGQGILDNTLCIFADFEKGEKLAVNISGQCNCNSELDFADTNVRINGSGTLKLNNCDEFAVKINGSGLIEHNTISSKADIHINGAGEVKLEKSHNTAIKINGSGTVNVKQARGGLSSVINGAGDVTCKGNVGLLVIDIRGAGDFKGDNLCVDEARITALSSADIKIGQIKNSSTERLGKDCELKVYKRGV